MQAQRTWLEAGVARALWSLALPSERWDHRATFTQRPPSRGPEPQRRVELSGRQRVTTAEQVPEHAPPSGSHRHLSPAVTSLLYHLNQVAKNRSTSGPEPGSPQPPGLRAGPGDLQGGQRDVSPRQTLSKHATGATCEGCSAGGASVRMRLPFLSNRVLPEGRSLLPTCSPLLQQNRGAATERVCGSAV